MWFTLKVRQFELGKSQFGHFKNTKVLKSEKKFINHLDIPRCPFESATWPQPARWSSQGKTSALESRSRWFKSRPSFQSYVHFTFGSLNLVISKIKKVLKSEMKFINHSDIPLYPFESATVRWRHQHLRWDRPASQTMYLLTYLLASMPPGM